MSRYEKIQSMVDTLEEIANDLKVVKMEVNSVMADGCEGCAFESTDEWEMPCAKCKRNCKDYWRSGEE